MDQTVAARVGICAEVFGGDWQESGLVKEGELFRMSVAADALVNGINQGVQLIFTTGLDFPELSKAGLDSSEAGLDALKSGLCALCETDFGLGQAAD
jgi:hypothetical protein